MPYRKLGYGDELDIETSDGVVTITKQQGGRLSIVGPVGVKVGTVRKRIRTKPRLQPSERGPIAISETDSLES